MPKICKCTRKTNHPSGLCCFCRPKKPIRKSSLNRTSKPLTEERKEDKNKMRAFFHYCYMTLPRCSEIPPYARFYGELRTYWWHHCFEKNDAAHPELKYSISNILRVTADEHQCLNSDLEYFEEAKIKREWIKNNWDFCVNESKEWEKMYEMNKNKFGNNN